MINNNNFGDIVKRTRFRHQMSSMELAKKAGISRPYISLIESNRLTPGPLVFQKLLQALSPNENEAEILNLSYSRMRNNILHNTERIDKVSSYIPETGSNTDFSRSKTITTRPQVIVPQDLNVLMADIVFITNNGYSVTLDVAQSLGPTNQLKIVSRIGLSPSHALSFYKLLGKKLRERKET